MDRRSFLASLLAGLAMPLRPGAVTALVLTPEVAPMTVQSLDAIIEDIYGTNIEAIKPSVWSLLPRTRTRGFYDAAPEARP